MRGPYDAAIEPRVGTVLLSYGDQPNGVRAVIGVLLGDVEASGKLPVRLASARTPEVQL